MKLDIKRVIDDSKRGVQKEIISALIFLIFFILFSVFLLPTEDKSFALITSCSFFGIILIIELKKLIYFLKFIKQPNYELQRSLDNTIFYSEKNYIITEDCIINISKPVIQIFYGDIIFMYKYKVREHDTIGKTEILKIYLKNRSVYEFCIKPGFPCRDDIKTIDFSNIILEKNPNVLVGKTKENKNILLEKYGIKL